VWCVCVCVCVVCVCVWGVDVCVLCVLHISSPARVSWYGLYVLVDIEND
jgi:hypothetical protein